ncbi:lysosomal beta glucosidase-like [Heracleum sosnowskyi]|uniref:beta-glucosidase n=1 Tax=Heracleum sosnowskyi TaxID=360622 RepID=A0AAD8GTH5_9APIA|nr:lysosomal beta glucosidase-like [Heracleum sosnowskyi]
MAFRRALQLSWCLIQVGMVSRCMLIMILLLIISRENWDFGGFVISDYEGIDRITTPPHAETTHIPSKLQFLLVLTWSFPVYCQLQMQSRYKVISMSRIDDAVSRILRFKFIAGLFENPMSDKSFVSYLGSKEHRELAREAVRKSPGLTKPELVLRQGTEAAVFSILGAVTPKN